jgi:hypothetical protein
MSNIIMFSIYFRLGWRFLIFLLGIVLAFGVVDKAVPYLHRYMPIGLVFLVIYLLAAYVAIPALIRLWRIVIKPNHLPIYATTSDGWASDPVNIAVVCRSRDHLVDVMEKAGWTVSPKNTLFILIRTGFAILLNKPYGQATMSRLYLFNRHQDVAFQLQDGTSPSPRRRHHVRFWKLQTPIKTDAQHDFWHQLMSLFKRQHSEVWIGAATHDISLIALRRNLQLTHQMDSDTNKARDFLIKTLGDIDCLRGEVEDITSGHELKFRGQQFGISIIVDGRLKVVRLKLL